METKIYHKLSNGLVSPLPSPYHKCNIFPQPIVKLMSCLFSADPDAPHLKPPLPVFVQQAAAARMVG